MQIKLISPDITYISSYLSFMDELAHNDDTVWKEIVPNVGESYSEFIVRLLKAEVAPTGAKVPETHYWALANHTVVGRISLRHYLNDNLKIFGGHIGYEVRPSYRRKGVAKDMLKQLLLSEKANSIGKLLLTCDPTNIASNKTILLNGGVLEKTAYVEKWKRNTNYYWIDLNSNT